MNILNKLLKNHYRYRFLLEQLITKTIKLKYRRSYLGVFWSLLEPLMTMAVLSFIFGSLLGRGDKYFPIYVLSGRLLYSFFSTGSKSTMRSIRANSSMIKKVYVPKYMYPLSACTSAYIIFLISLVDLFLMIFIMQMAITPYLLLSIVPILLLFLLTYGVGMLLATLNVFFRDIEYIWDVVQMLIMYTCAIFYKAESFAGTSTYYILQANPLFGLIQCFRDCIYGRPMDPVLLLYATGFSLAVFFAGLWIFRKKQDVFILHI